MATISRRDVRWAWRRVRRYRYAALGMWTLGAVPLLLLSVASDPHLVTPFEGPAVGCADRCEKECTTRSYEWRHQDPCYSRHVSALASRELGWSLSVFGGYVLVSFWASRRFGDPWRNYYYRRPPREEAAEDGFA